MFQRHDVVHAGVDTWFCFVRSNFLKHFLGGTIDNAECVGLGKRWRTAALRNSLVFFFKSFRSLLHLFIIVSIVAHRIQFREEFPHIMFISDELFRQLFAFVFGSQNVGI